MEDHDDLTLLTKLGLFITSYSPLFIILIIRQISKIPSHVNMLQFNGDWFRYYLGAAVLLAAILVGFLFVFLSDRSLEQTLNTNGVNIKVLSKENRNSDALAYLCMYVLSFGVQDLSQWGEVLTLFIMLTVAFAIYTQSDLICFNPILAFSRSVYKVEFQVQGDPGNSRTGIVIVPKSKNYRNNEFVVKNIGENIYYAKERF